MHLGVLQSHSQRHVLWWIWYRKGASLSLWLWMEAPFWSLTHMTNQCNLVCFDSSSLLWNYTFVASVLIHLFVFFPPFLLTVENDDTLRYLATVYANHHPTMHLGNTGCPNSSQSMLISIHTSSFSYFNLFSNKKMLSMLSEQFQSLRSVKFIGGGTIFRLMLL